jgi:hypothetical protein
VTRRKPTIESGQPARRPTTDDAERAAIEACQLLGLGDDPSRLCPADRLRCDLVSALRCAIDHAGATAMEGGSADVGRLVSAVEQLTKLLPRAAVEAPSHRADPRKALLALILEMRDRDEAAERAEEPSLRERIAVLEAENKRLRAAAPGAAVEADVVPPCEISDRDLGPRPGPDDPRPPTVIEGKAMPAPAEDMDAVDLRYGFNNTPEPWKEFATDVDGVPLSVRGRKYWGPV